MPTPKKTSASSIVKNLAKQGNAKFVGPRNLNSLQAAEEAGINRSMYRNEDPGYVDPGEFRRQQRMVNARQQSSEDAYLNLVNLIKKMSGSDKKKMLTLQKVANARKA